MKKCGQYRAKFGKGPIWHEAYGIMWLDIASKRIITYNPATEQENVYDALGWIKAIIPLKDGRFIGIYKDGLYHLNFKQGIKSPFVIQESWNNMCYLNDGKCGPDGQIWVGSSDGFFKSFKESPHTAFSQYPFSNSKLYCINTFGNVSVQVDGITLSNGLDWDRKTNKFYHIDSSKYSIYQYQLMENDQIQFEKIVYTFEMDEGFPAGMAVDGEGNLWVSLFKGGIVASISKKPTRIVCINPRKMQVIKEIVIPLSHISSCTIGGEKMDTLFVTTAYEPLSEEKVKQEPFAGYLLQMKIESIGVANYEFALNNENSKR
ncbi:SMP-30/gluconolactonase/LRE family protein [Pradoshia sp. D12]|uniref:SMP-30/gluconolactonase/LRE family protein n=1 Tax=Bacillaceae TaxID=186817 RepID=UPI001120ABC6|nr:MULTISPECIES: SMP-30/gluconolactonase/LRE family protein [Bacillaceae]QFK71904.1 SMP-30/gluconolactonase/LRE family protein [Pradoshia sp. D12]TPF73698.1 SMP-30/gluconolactonase/LRE family protein [Bacillus sp. D12]